MEKKHTILRVIATLYKIVAFIFLVLTVLSAVITLVAQPRVDLGFGIPSGPAILAVQIMMVIGELIAGALVFLGVYAIGDLIYLFIDIEENTRFSALLMRDRMTPPQPVAPAPMAPPPQPVMQMPPPPPYEQP